MSAGSSASRSRPSSSFAQQGRLLGIRQPSSADKFKALLTKAAKVDIKLLSGGTNTGSNPCEADTHHGFQGQDAEVVQLVSDWLKALPKP